MAAILIGAWAVLVIAGALSGLSSPLAMSWASLILHPMTLEFILGAVAGLAITKGYIWRSGILTLLATLWLLAALCYQGQETAFPARMGPRALVRASRCTSGLRRGRTGHA